MRRQLPAYSPVSLSGIWRAALDARRSPDSAREGLRVHLAERFAADRVCLTGSGTDALRLGLELAKRTRASSPGLVALPAYSCYDVVTAAVGAGVRASFYDIDPKTLSPDMESLEHALGEGAAAVVAGNLFAFPIDWTAVRSLCDRAGALLVEDAAQGLGSGWGGRDFGTFGDLTVLSFGRGKGWTGGGGGALLVRGAAMAATLEQTCGARLQPRATASARAAVLASAQWALGRPRLYGLVTALPGSGLGETRYKEPLPAAGIPAFSAALAVMNAHSAQELVAVRRRWAVTWQAALELGRDGMGERKTPAAECVPLARGICGYLRYPLLMSGPKEAGRVTHRAARSGVVRAYPRTLSHVARSAGMAAISERDRPGASCLAGGLILLPTHSMVSERDLERFVAHLTSV